MRERAFAKADLERERAVRDAPQNPQSLLSRLIARFR
jgi:hypothetical protein